MFFARTFLAVAALGLIGFAHSLGSFILNENDSEEATRFVSTTNSVGALQDILGVSPFAGPPRDLRRSSAKSYSIVATQERVEDPAYVGCLSRVDIAAKEANVQFGEVRAFTAEPKVRVRPLRFVHTIGNSPTTFAFTPGAPTCRFEAACVNIATLNHADATCDTTNHTCNNWYTCRTSPQPTCRGTDVCQHTLGWEPTCEGFNTCHVVHTCSQGGETCAHEGGETCNGNTCPFRPGPTCRDEVSCIAAETCRPPFGNYTCGTTPTCERPGPATCKENTCVPLPTCLPNSPATCFGNTCFHDPDPACRKPQQAPDMFSQNPRPSLDLSLLAML